MQKKYYFLIGFLVLIGLIVGGILIFSGNKNISMSPDDENCDYVGEVENIDSFFKYCDSSGDWIVVLAEGEVCLNDYECSEKSCIDGICQDKYSPLAKRGWIEEIRCFLPNYCCADECQGTSFLECFEGDLTNKGQINGKCGYVTPHDPPEDPPVNPQSCFPGYTLITMKDGSQEQIKEVEVNDEVLSYDVENNDFVFAEVLELESPIREGIYLINNLINVTDEHPFYIKKDNKIGWGAINALHAKQDSEIKEDILDLEIGDFLFNGNWVEVESIEYFPGLIQTYNLKTVNNYNNFFANNFLVHNKGDFCTPVWGCTDWSNLAGNCGTRVCTMKTRCNLNKPSESEECPGVEPFCGDGVCDSVESCLSCEKDCGGCALVKCDVRWLWWLLLILLVVYFSSILSYYLYKRYEKKKELEGEGLDKKEIGLVKKPTAENYSKNLDHLSNKLFIPPVSSPRKILPKNVVKKNLLMNNIPINLNKKIDILLRKGNSSLMKKDVLTARAIYKEIRQNYNSSSDPGDIYKNKIKEFYNQITSFRSS